MKRFWLSILSAGLVSVTACSSDPATSDEYLLLSSEVAALKDQRNKIDEQILAAEESLVVQQAERKISEESVQVLQEDLDRLILEIANLELMETGLAAELDTVSAAVADARAEVIDFKETSTRYTSAVRRAIPSYQRHLCRRDWEADLSRLIRDLDGTQLASDVGSGFPDDISDVDMRRVQTDFAEIDCGLWGDDELFGSEAAVLNRICERVNIEKLKKNPSSYAGQCFRGTGAYVTQFDVNTGPRTFHASLGSRYGERVEFKLDRISGESLYEDVRFDWWAVGNGSRTYQTAIGGSNTIPSFTIFWYQYY